MKKVETKSTNLPSIKELLKTLKEAFEKSSCSEKKELREIVVRLINEQL